MQRKKRVRGIERKEEGREGGRERRKENVFYMYVHVYAYKIPMQEKEERRGRNKSSLLAYLQTIKSWAG